MSFVYCTYCHVTDKIPWTNDRCPNCGGEAATIPVQPAEVLIPGYAPLGVIERQKQSLWDELQAAKADVALLSRECERLERENDLMRSRLNNSPNIIRRRRCAG